jgi:23S rRNA (cytosine1962-C5)-methyltransferase
MIDSPFYCTLLPGKESSVLRKHPWIFSGALKSIATDIPSGADVDVFDVSGNWLCRGAYSPTSQIRIRIWTYNRDEQINADFFTRKITEAQLFRKLVVPQADTAYRLINGESDGLPGLLVDVYDSYVVCQFLAAGVDAAKEIIVKALENELAPTGIYERSDADVRSKEGLPVCCGVLSGKEPPAFIEVTENEAIFLVDVKNGHKTGMYLDQRYNRARVSAVCKNKEVLNCFSYTGGFGLIDSSAESLLLAQNMYERNGCNDSRAVFLTGDVFKVLRTYRNEAKSFDCIILDPPKFAESRVQLDGAARGYKDINLLAFKLVRPGGFLITFSCSGLMVSDLFQKIVADAALDSGRTVRIVERLYASADHPFSTGFPEGSYLKGFICHVQ